MSTSRKNGARMLGFPVVSEISHRGTAKFWHGHKLSRTAETPCLGGRLQNFCDALPIFAGISIRRGTGDLNGIWRL